MSSVIRVGVGRRPAALRVHRFGRAADAPALRPLLEARQRQHDLTAATAELQSATLALQAAVAAIPAQVQAQVAEVADHATRLGVAVATGLTRGALALDAFDPAAVVTHALGQAVHGSDAAVVEVRVAARDHQRAAVALEQAAGVVPVVDAELEPGAVRVTTAAGTFRYSIEQAAAEVVDRLARQLGVTMDSPR